MRFYGHIPLLRFAAVFPAILALHAVASIYYVDINSPNPVPPYTSWATAATNIQDAVNAAVNGNLIMVNPGVYQSGGETVNGYGLTNRLAITGPLIVESTEGPTNTIIQGYQVPGTPNASSSVRCVYMTNNAVLIGFTLRGGGTLASGDAVHEESGGGVWCESTNARIFDCVISGNAAFYGGGGVAQGTLQYCSVSQNAVDGGTTYGGGAYDSDLANCMVVSNNLAGNNAYGAGVYNSDVTNSVIAGNSMFPAFNSYGGGACMGNLENCNITGNWALDGGGTYYANLVNCIDYFNTGAYPGTSNFDSGTITYTCTVPNPGGSGDIAGDPLLASISHISLGSPCRGAGTAAATSGVDIDSNPWGNPPSMGCFEPYPGSVLGNVIVSISSRFTNWAPGYPLSFYPNISGPIYSNIWNFGDGTFVTNEIYVSHTWSTVGNYPVTVTAYNDSYPGGVTGILMVNIAVPKVYYVNLDNFGPAPPYMTWDTAAMNIQDAVNVATPGSLILVTNGPTFPIYPENNNMSNSSAFYFNGGATAPDGNFYRVVITNNITVESVNGPASTYIWGPTPAPYGNPSADCVYLTNGAVLSGFTITNGSFSPFLGQITATSTNAIITNCVMTHYVNANSGTLENCTFVLYSGAANSVLNNCWLVNNSGAANSTMNSCVVSNNSSVLGGVLNNCILLNNSNQNSGQGGAATASQGYPLILNNCLISNNVSQIIHGGGYGGGVYNAVNNVPLYYTNCVLNNCTLAGNSATEFGGGAYCAELNNCLISSNNALGGGGAYGGLLNDCTIISNSNNGVSGSSVGAPGLAVLNNCTLIGNARSGAFDCVLSQCTLLQNTSQNQGGGAGYCTLNDCLVISNSAPLWGGGVNNSTLTNCILADNTAGTSGGGTYISTLVNCTVTGNKGITGGGAYECTADNSIFYYNSGGDFSPNSTTYPLNYCCASSLATSGIRNITNAPLFVNAAGNGFHLQANSPCINSGNNAYITTAATDLDGNPRIAGGTVDIGAYEYQTPTSIISYAYLQQYGLPTDGSVDFTDPDGTGFNVYQDWVADLNPTNPASVLAMFVPKGVNNAGGVTVSWQTMSGVLYNLQRSTNLAAQPSFSTIQTNIIGQVSRTSYTDGTATNSVPYFYRVSVVAP